MGLVDYSDSDDSNNEDATGAKATPRSNRSTFQKVVDRSNQGKILVSLPEPIHKAESPNDEHPAKRIKTGGSSLFDFKSFLPPPKRTGQSSTGGPGGGSGFRKTGIAAGVSLKTGVTPGFSRELEETAEHPDSNNAEIDSKGQAELKAGGLNLPLPKKHYEDSQKPAEEAKSATKPLIFKPLSVARHPAKKKKGQTQFSANSSGPSMTTSALPMPKKLDKHVQRPKISLFSVENDDDNSLVSPSDGEYQPMIYGATGHEGADSELPPLYPGSSHNGEYEEVAQPPSYVPSSSMQGAQSLNEIASDLNLSAAERRQLFGRQKGSRNGSIPSATEIINFNTDEEYKHNEELRAAGETVVHNPVRAIAPGKHSLRQLVNAAQSQKDALEESFAKGKNNRAEASSRYGW